MTRSIGDELREKGWAMTGDRFVYLPELAADFGKSVGHLRKVAEAQHGVFTKKRFSNKALASYPKFQRGPGRRWGIFKSALDRYWSDLRAKPQNVIDASEKFRRRA